MSRLVIVDCPRNRIEKSMPAEFAGEHAGAPTIRLHASGTQIDKAASLQEGTAGDKVSDELLDSMLAQAQAGKVRLIDNHKETFPLGWSFGGEISLDPTGSRELHVDFWLDKDHPLFPIVMKYIAAGWEPQCSIGLLDNGGKNRVVQYDKETGQRVGLLLDAPFDHLAFTPPNMGAYRPAGVDFVVAKSLAEAAAVLKSTDGHPVERKPAMKMSPDDLHKRLKEATDSRGVRKEAIAKCKGDAMALNKAAAEHAGGLAALAKDVMEMDHLSPEDTQAYLQHLADENTVMAEALADAQADAAETEAGTDGAAAPEPAAAAPATAPAKEGADAPALEMEAGGGSADPTIKPPEHAAHRSSADPEIGKEDGGFGAMKEAEAEAARFKEYMADTKSRSKEAEALAKEATSEAAMYKRFKEAEAMKKSSPPSTDGKTPDRPGVSPVAKPGLASNQATTPVAKDGLEMAAGGGAIFKSMQAVIEKQQALIAKQAKDHEALSSRIVAVEKMANTAAAPYRFMPGDGVTEEEAAANAQAKLAGMTPSQREALGRAQVQQGLRAAWSPFLRRHTPPA